MPRATGKYRSLRFALAAAALAPIAAPAVQRGVVIQVSNASRLTWHIALANSKNLLARNHSPIELIVLGRGVLLLKRRAPFWKRLIRLHARGLQVDACGCDLTRLHLRRAEMSPIVHYVPSAIAEIVRRERQGWVYIKP